MGPNSSGRTALYVVILLVAVFVGVPAVLCGLGLAGVLGTASVGNHLVDEFEKPEHHEPVDP